VTQDPSRRPPPLLARLRALSERQRAALRRVLAGDSDAEVAEHLGISELEALRLLRAVYECLGVTRRHQLLVKLLPLMVELYRQSGRGY
jgi:DNA-binding CsgD family transcriptional regulator